MLLLSALFDRRGRLLCAPLRSSQSSSVSNTWTASATSMAPTTDKYPEYQSDLDVMGLKLDQRVFPKLKTVNSQYRKESLKRHPDKGGEKEDFQKLNKAFIRLSTFIAQLPNDDDEDDDENDQLKEFFRKFNDIKINIASHTIFLENKFTSQWEEVLTKNYGPPITKDSATIWSLFLQSKKVTVSLYKKPRSDGITKLLIQSPGYFIFTAHQLPILYKQVVELSNQILAIAGTPANYSASQTDLSASQSVLSASQTNLPVPQIADPALTNIINTGSPGWKSKNVKKISPAPLCSTPLKLNNVHTDLTKQNDENSFDVTDDEFVIKSAPEPNSEKLIDNLTPTDNLLKSVSKELEKEESFKTSKSSSESSLKSLKSPNNIFNGLSYLV